MGDENHSLNNVILNHTEIINNLRFQKKLIIILTALFWILPLCIYVYIDKNETVNIVFLVMYCFVLLLTIFSIYKFIKVSKKINHLLNEPSTFISTYH